MAALGVGQRRDLEAKAACKRSRWRIGRLRGKVLEAMEFASDAQFEVPDGAGGKHVLGTIGLSELAPQVRAELEQQLSERLELPDHEAVGVRRALRASESDAQCDGGDRKRAWPYDLRTLAASREHPSVRGPNLGLLLGF